MTRVTSARIAGVTYLVYIAAGLSAMALFGRAARGDGMAAVLASLAEHRTEVGLAYLLSAVMAFSAITLGVTHLALTRDEDADIAMFGLVCRLAEGVVGAAIPTGLVMLWLATAPDLSPELAQGLARVLRRLDSLGTLVSATFFAVGSTAFTWLFLRGRLIPVPLAWLGFAASLLLVVGLPLQLAGFLRGTVTTLMWIPMAAFEIPFGLWLIVRYPGRTVPRTSPNPIDA
jgi:Domain of unknown function (DUF4386)